MGRAPKTYKLWLEVEEYDPATDEHHDVDEPLEIALFCDGTTAENRSAALRMTAEVHRANWGFDGCDQCKKQRVEERAI